MKYGNPSIYREAFWIGETRPDVLLTRFTHILRESGFQILGNLDHHFSPQGYTAVWLLAESHLAIHTFPEAGKSCVELSSCNQEKLMRFLQLSKEFQPQTWLA